MKIGTMLYFNSLEEMEKSFIKLRAFGFASCQLCSWEPEKWTDENADGIRALAEKHGIEISSFWCGWEGPKVWDFYEGQRTLGLVPPQYREMRVKNLCDGADFAHRIGLTDVATHMGFIPECPFDPNFEPLCDAIRTVAQHLKTNGQYLLFETGQETPVTMLRCFEQVGMDNLGVNLDTANLILYGRGNPVDALEVIGKYVRNLHAKDGCFPVNGHNIGLEKRIGEGKVDFPRLFKALRRLGYDSFVTIEREIEEGSPEQLRDILDARSYLQKIIDEVYTQ